MMLLGAPMLPVALQGRQAATRGGPFGVLNGALARDVVVVVVPAGTDVLQPLHILFLSTGRLLGQAVPALLV